MSAKALARLGVVYVWGLIVLFLTVVYDFRADLRALLLLIAFSPIVGVHLSVAFDSAAWKTRRLFLVLSLLWIVKVLCLAINEGLHFFLGRGIPTLEWIDLVGLLIIALTVSLSFMLGNPFFYERRKSKAIVLAGVVGFILSLWVTAMVGLSVIDIYWAHSSLIIKIR